MIGALNTPDIGATLMSAFQAGQDKRREYETRGALFNYLQNPSEAAALAVGAFDPMTAIRLREHEADRQAAAQKAENERIAAELRKRAAVGDKEAMAELAGIDFQAYNALDANAQQELKRRSEYIGNAALRISQATPEQRPLLWDHAIDEGVARGFNDLSAYKGKYSPQALNAALDGASLAQEFLSVSEPKLVAPPVGSALVNVRDPAAVAEYNRSVGGGGDLPTVSDQQSYDAVPPGSRYRDPRGVVRTKPGGGVGNGTGGF